MSPALFLLAEACAVTGGGNLLIAGSILTRGLINDPQEIHLHLGADADSGGSYSHLLLIRLASGVMVVNSGSSQTLFHLLETNLTPITSITKA